MNIRNILIIISIFFASCNSTQQVPDRAEIQEMFNVATGVKEIYTVSVLVTTAGERRFISRTTFTENGEPIETKTYNKDGEIEKTEPWTRAKEDEFKGSIVKQEFDKNKRLIKSTKYDNDVVTYQVQYKYDALGNKIGAYEKDKKIEYKYSDALLKEETTFNKAEDNQFYWYCKKTFKYDERSNLAEMLVYYYPDEKTASGKYLYKYDSKGSLIQTIGYAGNEAIEKTDRKIVYY